MTALPRHLRTVFALGCAWVFACLASASAQTPYRDIPLDCGGWVSGYAQHAGTGRLYGFGDIFGLYRSDDFGSNWHFLQNGFAEDATFVVGVTVHPSDANRVAFTGFKTTWTSTDAGETWTKRLGDLAFGTNTRGSTPLLYHPTQANELWLASPRNGQAGTLWRTTDNGASWALVGGTAFVNERATTIHFFPAAPNEVWVGTEALGGLSTTGGLWCSADGGTSWTKVWSNGGAQTTYYGAPKVHSIARNASRTSVFSTNTGIWRVAASNWNSPVTYVVSQATFANQSVNVTALVNGSFWAREGGSQTWPPKISADGVTWTDRQITLTTGFVPEWSTAAQITASNRIFGRDMLVQDVADPNRWLLCGGASSFLSEDNGITWRYQPGGMAGIAGWRTTFDRVNPGRAYLATSDRGIFVVNDGGLSGQTAHCSRKAFDELHTYHEAMVSADGQTIVGAGVNQELNRTVIIRSTDGGANWSKVTSSGLPDSYEGVQRAVMSLNDSNDYLVLLGYTSNAGQPNNPGLYRTTNGGTSFTKVGGTSFDGIDTGSRYHHYPSYLERDGINANIRYLALRSENNSFNRGVWRSTDGGTSWTQRTDPFGGQWIWAFAVDPSVEGRLWVGGPSLRRSNDGGGTWTAVSNFVDVKSIDAYAGRLAVLGRRTGDTFNKIYISADNGTSWLEQTGAQNRMIWAKTLAVDPWRPGQTWFSGSRSWQIFNPPTAVSDPPGIYYPFNSGQANFESTFNETAGWGALWNATAGTGATGGLTSDPNERAGILPASPITFNTAGQALDLGIAFKARVTAGVTNTAGGEGLSLGLNRVDTPPLISGAYLVAGISEATPNSLSSALSAGSRNNVPGTVNTTDTNVLTLEDNEWYALDATIIYNGANAFTVTSRIYGLGTAGTDTPSLLGTYSVTRTDLDSLVGIPLFAGFQGRSAGGFGGVRAFDDFYVGLPTPTTALATFRTTHALASDGSQDTASPAGDGVPNLLKYAFNMLGVGLGQATMLATPNAASLAPAGSAGLPFVSIGAGPDVGKLQLTFIRRKASASPAPGVTYAVEFTNDLGLSDHWATNPSATETATSLDATFERVTFTDSLASPSRRFARVKVTAP